MSREMYTELTKEMLKDWGITKIIWKPEINSWEITRYWYKNNSKTKREIKLAVSNAICKHRFTKDKSYPIVSFSYKGQPICLPLARIVYAWFHPGKSIKGLVIDHKDNDPYNNKLNNLRAISQEANLVKRYLDNPDCYINQYKQFKDTGMNEKYKICTECFNEGKSYEEAQRILVELYYTEE